MVSTIFIKTPTVGDPPLIGKGGKAIKAPGDWEARLPGTGLSWV